MVKAYKRQLKDKNQDYIYPVLDPADLSGKLDKVSTSTGTFRTYTISSTGGQQTTQYTSGDTGGTIMYRDANGNTAVATPTANNHATTKKYVDGGFKKLDGTNYTGSFTGIDNNTAGYRLICTIKPGTWSNYRLIMAVSGRHGGNGIYFITAGCNASSVTQGNEYCQILYYGNQQISSGTSSGGVTENMLRMYRNGTTMYLFARHQDYDSHYYTIIQKYGGFPNINFNGPWMTSIGPEYGSLYVSTVIR